MEDQVHVRIDNRLLHGQVVQFWIPYLEVTRIVVADDTVASDDALLTIYQMAVPRGVSIAIMPVSELNDEIMRDGRETTLVLLCNVADAERAVHQGVTFTRLVLGNIHAAPDRERITDSVYLSDQEKKTLARFHGQGVKVEIQTFPNETLHLRVDPEGEPQW